MKLPDLPINVVVRADSSGTTFVFSQHLSAINDEFGKGVGANTMPNWPVGTKSKRGGDREHHDDAGLDRVHRIRLCKEPESPHRRSRKQVRQVRAASTTSGQAALASATLPDNMIAWVSDPEVADAYPIVTYTWLICYKKYPDKNKLQALQDLVKYGLTDRQKDAETMGYIPLPWPGSSIAPRATREWPGESSSRLGRWVT